MNSDVTPHVGDDDTATDTAGPVLLDVRGLHTGYDGVPVLHGIDLEVRAGEVVALLGANGAGKTTTLLAVSGLLAVLDGEIELFGEVAPNRRRARAADVWSTARRGLAHVPEDRGLFFDLTAAENLRLGALPGASSVRRRGRDADDDRPPLHLDEVLELFPALRDKLDRRAGLLSGGEQQMLALARAMLGRPRLLCVDELSLGLAPIIVEQLLPTLRSVATEFGTGVLVVEQHVGLVLGVSDRAYVLDRGRVLTEGTASDLAGRLGDIEAGYLGTAPET